MNYSRFFIVFVLAASSVSGISMFASAQSAGARARKPRTAPPPPDVADAGSLSAKVSTRPLKDGGAGAESRAVDGGTQAFRLGEVEVEGRLKSPQIVYFLRRVRAEFATAALGHRSFVPELSETRNEPGF